MTLQAGTLVLERALHERTDDLGAVERDRLGVIFRTNRIFHFGVLSAP